MLTRIDVEGTRENASQRASNSAQTDLLFFNQKSAFFSFYLKSNMNVHHVITKWIFKSVFE